MLTRQSQRNLIWIDLVAPTAIEVRELMREFNLNPKVAQELLSPSRTKAERYEETLFVVLHFPSIHGTQVWPEQEVNFIVGRGFLITARYEAVEPLSAFAKVFEVEAVLGHLGSTHGAHLFAALLRSLYRTTGAQCLVLKERVREIESHIFAGRERTMVLELSHASRAVHDVRQTLLSHEETLSSLEALMPPLFGHEFAYYLRGVEGDYHHALQELNHLRDFLVELRETNNSLLTTKQNDVMRTLTMMAFVTFPLTLVAAVFSMNTRATPIVDNPYGFWIILGAMALIAVLLLFYFKRKGWL